MHFQSSVGLLELKLKLEQEQEFGQSVSWCMQLNLGTKYASRDKIPLNIASRDKIPLNIAGYRCNIARFSVLAGQFYIVFMVRGDIYHLDESGILHSCETYRYFYSSEVLFFTAMKIPVFSLVKVIFLLWRCKIPVFSLDIFTPT